MGALKGQKRVAGSSLIKLRIFDLSHFGIMFEMGPEKHECYQVEV